jgi:hypothetical protein
MTPSAALLGQGIGCTIRTLWSHRAAQAEPRSAREQEFPAGVPQQGRASPLAPGAPLEPRSRDVFPAVPTTHKAAALRPLVRYDRAEVIAWGSARALLQGIRRVS